LWRASLKTSTYWSQPSVTAHGGLLLPPLLLLLLLLLLQTVYNEAD